MHYKSASFILKKADGQAFRSAEVQKSAGNFSHGLEFSIFLQHIPIVLADWEHKILWYVSDSLITEKIWNV